MYNSHINIKEFKSEVKRIEIKIIQTILPLHSNNNNNKLFVYLQYTTSTLLLLLLTYQTNKIFQQ